MLEETLVTARKRSLQRLCFYRCLSVHTGRGGHAWFYLGGMHGLFGGCMVLFREDMHGFIWEACMVLFGGACMVLFGGGHAWFYSGVCMVLFGGMHGFIWRGMRGFIWGGMCGFFSFFRYNEIRSMSGRYASYWNAFLLDFLFISKRQ